MMQTTTIKKWGNSLAVRLPAGMANATHLQDGSFVHLVVENGSILVTPTRKRYSLSDLLEGHQRPEHPLEYDWGQPVGEEVW